MYYVMYLRKSRADLEAEARGEQETLARHRAALTELAERNGHVINHVYAEVVSGETIAARPQMQKLLMDIADPECIGVYVMEVERLARGDTMDQGRVAQAFLYSNTKIITPSKVYDPLNEFDQEYFEFGLFMSRREYKTINRRIQAGRKQSIREGKYICSRPAYGYKRIKLPKDKGYTLEVIPDEAAVVRQIYNWYVMDRIGVTRISSRLQVMGVPTGEQGTGWAPCRIYRILTNEVYIGMIRWGRVKTRKQLTEAGIDRSLIMSNDYELHNGMHEAIIDQKTYEEAQRIMHSRRIPMRNDMQQSNPLAGILRCKVCGHYMRGVIASGRQEARVFCPTHGCPTIRNYRQPVENAILNELRDWLKKYEADIDPFESLHPAIIDDNAMIENSIKKQHAEREQLDKQKSTLHDLLERGVYDVDTFQERMFNLQSRISTIDQAIGNLQNQLKQSGPTYSGIGDLVPAIHHVIDLYDMATPAEKCGLLKEVVSVIDYTKTVRGMPGVSANQFSLDIYPRQI